MCAKYLLAAVLTLLALASHADTDKDSCSNLRSHAESRSCLEQTAKLSSQDLKKEEADLAAVIERWDEEKSWRQAITKALQQSSREFEIYRRYQCDFIATVAAGGNGAGDMRLECIIGLNQQRLKELRGIKKGF